MHRDLTRVATKVRVRVVVFQVGDSRAPRSDGFPVLSYCQLWDDVGAGAITVLKCFFNTNIIPVLLNQSDITLIPKVTNLICPSKFRPISLLTSAI